MIIKATVNDNDYTGALRLFFQRFKFDTLYHYIRTKYEGNINEYVPRKIEAEDLLKKAMYKEKEMTESEKSVFVDIIRNSLCTYLEYNNIKLSLDDIKVSIEENVTNEDVLNSNGEVVFYFLQQDEMVVV